MKIYALLLVKNEVDIIGSVLKSATQWSDKIIVFDNGSTDGTWEKVNEISKNHPTIIPYIQEDRPFRIGLRSILFNAFKNEMTQEDWWCIRMDGDEFYLDNPREFLSTVPTKYKQVWKDSIDFQLTKEDVEEYTFVNTFEEDEAKITYYKPKTWTEIRFLRHSDKLRWDIKQKLPVPRGLIYPKKIRVKHVQFRNPIQLEKRFKTRQQAISDNCKSFKHERGKSWKDYLANRKDLIKDTHDGEFHTTGYVNNHHSKRSILLKSILNFFKNYD